MAEESVQDRILAATQALWENARPRIDEQVTAIEKGVMALLEGRLDEETRALAQREAHKVAGSAGTFGFPRASEIARDLEIFFESRSSVAAGATQAAILVEALHASLASSTDEAVTSTIGQCDARHRAELPTSPPPPEDRSAQPEGAVVVLTGSSEAFITGVAVHARARGLEPTIVEPLRLHGTLEATEPPAAAVVQLTSDHSAERIELVRALDERGVPVVVVLPKTANTAARLAALRAGARLLLDVPIESPAGCAQVADAVATLVSTRNPAAYRILAVDDDETVLLAIRHLLLGTAMLEIATLSQPDRFWSELRRFEPDLILIDIDMPGVSGLELCRLVRSDPRWRHLPVVFLSGRSTPHPCGRSTQPGPTTS